MEQEGWDALKPYEMVEIILYHAVPRQDLSRVSRLLVKRFGGVGGVFGATMEQLTAVDGVSDHLAEWICLTGGLIRAYLSLHDRVDIRLKCFRDVLAFLKSRPARVDDICSWALLADYEFNLIACIDLKESPAWWDTPNVRMMVTEAIGCGARYVYLVFRRECGPAGMDAAESARLDSIAATLRAADMDLVDCVLMSHSGIHSMNLNGEMNDIRAESGCAALHERYGEP